LAVAISFQEGGLLFGPPCISNLQTVLSITYIELSIGQGQRYVKA